MAETLWQGLLKCRDCGAVLNTANNVPEREKWRVGLSAPLNAKPCPNGCRATYSDCNMNIRVDWQPQPVGSDKRTDGERR